MGPKITTDLKIQGVWLFNTINIDLKRLEAFAKISLSLFTHFIIIYIL